MARTRDFALVPKSWSSLPPSR